MNLNYEELPNPVLKKLVSANTIKTFYNGIDDGEEVLTIVFNDGTFLRINTNNKKLGINFLSYSYISPEDN